MQERAQELLGDCSRNPLLTWNLEINYLGHYMLPLNLVLSQLIQNHTSIFLWYWILSPYWLLYLLLPGIPTKIIHKFLIYSSHASCFTHLILPHLITKNIMKTDEVNMLPQWILGSFCPVFQQLSYEADCSPPSCAQIRNVVSCTHALTQLFRYPYLIMCFSPFSCSFHFHNPKYFPP